MRISLREDPEGRFLWNSFLENPDATGAPVMPSRPMVTLRLYLVPRNQDEGVMFDSGCMWSTAPETTVAKPRAADTVLAVAMDNSNAMGRRSPSSSAG